MEREDFIKRKQELEGLKKGHLESKQKFEIAMAQAEANIQACNGALQDCDHWLSMLDKKEEKKTPIKKLEKETKN